MGDDGSPSQTVRSGRSRGNKPSRSARVRGLEGGQRTPQATPEDTAHEGRQRGRISQRG